MRRLLFSDLFPILGPVMAFALLSSRFASAVTLTPVSTVRSCNSLHSVDFIPSLEAFAQIGLPLQTANASKRLHFDDESGCSSSVISDRGHLLTAGHCMRICLTSAQADSRSSLQPGGAVMIRANAAMIATGNVTCDISIDGVQTKMRILAMDGCMFDVVSEATANAREFKACSEVDDYAVLEPVNPPTQPVSCLRASPSETQIGDSISTIGFPQTTQRKTLRPGARDAEYKKQYVTFGAAVSQETCTLVGQKSFGLVRKTRALHRSEYSKARELQITADANHGSSGGSVLNPQAELVGLVKNGLDQDAGFFLQNEECAGAVFATPISIIKKDLSEQAPNVLKSAFECQAGAIHPLAPVGI